MFEGIGRRDDNDDRKRQATSVAITTLLCAAGLGFWMGVAAWHWAEPVAAAPVDEEMEPLVLDLSMAVPNTPLPEAPAPKIVQKGEPEPEATPAPDPDTTPDELKEPPDKEVKAQAGDRGGSSDGDPDGTLDGREDGIGDGEGTGELGAHTVHVGELQWKKRPVMEWPRAATSLGIDEVSCLADVLFADTGDPVSVTIRGCPTVFHADTRAAILASRVWPFKVEGRKVSVRSTIRVRYVLR